MVESVGRDGSIPEAVPRDRANGIILVIDDDAAVLHSLAAILEDAGFRVHTASDGAKGLAVFHAVRPDVVLTDIIMPEKEGIAVTMEIRRECPDVKIIAMSGGGRMGKSDFLEIASKLGADLTLAKPFDGDQLLSALHEVTKAKPHRRGAAA
jgi:CheY-like chemotaxis protein